ncbi:MAG: ADP-dependent glucokinase/phosphofructokinase [Methanothrix sp.]|nr:ADP-dependent glucokinase/phosphofructokinase [Methanothrix sp.]
MNVICAYTANVDAVCNICGEEISRLLPRDIKIELKQSIASREDLLSCLLFCMMQGSGAEILIENDTVARQIEESFSWQFRLGGNAAIMANVLALLGAKPVLNAPALGPRLASMLHSAVSVPGFRAESPLQEEKTEMVHFVFQFKKGSEILSDGRRIIAPNDNRFIATYDPVNTRILSSQDFDNYCRENVEDIDGALLSGFHLAPLKGYQEIFTERIAQIRSWKEKNPQIFIHAEMGSFQSPVVMHSLLSLLPKIPADSLGLNEDELAAAEVLQPGLSPSGWQESMQAAMRLRERLGIFRVAVHTRDYILSVMQQGMISAQDELIALNNGVEAATSLAATGIANSKAEAEINPLGLDAVEEFCRNGAIGSRRGAFLHQGKVIVSLMPSLVVHKPRITVGLGDTATATMFFQELLAIRKMSD